MNEFETIDKKYGEISNFKEKLIKDAKEHIHNSAKTAKHNILLFKSQEESKEPYQRRLKIKQADAFINTRKKEIEGLNIKLIKYRVSINEYDKIISEPVIVRRNCYSYIKYILWVVVILMIVALIGRRNNENLLNNLVK